MSEQLENIKNSIGKINDKDFGIYFFTLDTKGNPTAGVATIYENAKKLRDLGYNAQILHDKNDYKLREDEEGMGIAEWLGEEYATIPHISIESQELQVGPQDFVIIPEAAIKAHILPSSAGSTKDKTYKKRYWQDKHIDELQAKVKQLGILLTKEQLAPPHPKAIGRYTKDKLASIIMDRLNKS